MNWLGQEWLGVTQGSEHLPGMVLTLLQKIVICTKWNSSTMRQGRCAQELDRFQVDLLLENGCPNLCSWGHSMKHGDLLEIRVLFGAQIVGLRENVFRVMGTRDSWTVEGRSNKSKGAVDSLMVLVAEGPSEWYMLVRKMSGKGGY